MKTISILNENDLKEAFSNQGERYLNLKITVNNKIVGFCICQQVIDEATLFNIAIHPKYRKQGLAKALLNRLIDELMAMSNTISTLWLEVRESNRPAIDLYHSIGFNQITIRKNYYPTASCHQEDAIIMAYTLAL